MANELSLSASMAYTKLSSSLSADFEDSISVAGENFVHHTQNIQISTPEIISVGEVVMGGYMSAVNRDTTNFIEITSGVAEVPLIRLLPGEFCIFRVAPGASLYGESDTAECLLEYWVFEA